MLRIFTDNTMSPKKYLVNIEAAFDINGPTIENMYKDSLSIEILEKMEGMTSRNGKYINAKFGTVTITDISTGCKALLLCATQNKDCIICTDEMGNNAIKILAEISKEKDIDIMTHQVLKYFPSDCNCYVNNELCSGEDIPYALAELLDKEVL